MKTRSLISQLSALSFVFLSSVLCLSATAAVQPARFIRPALPVVVKTPAQPAAAPSVAPAASVAVPSAPAPAFVPITKAELIRVFQRFLDQAYLRRSRLVLGTTPADPVALQDCETEIRAYTNAIDHAELLPDEK